VDADELGRQKLQAAVQLHFVDPHPAGGTGKRRCTRSDRLPTLNVMGTIIITGTVVLVVLGFGNPLYWLAAVALLYVYVQSGRGSSTSSTSSTSSGSAPGTGTAPTTYKAYRARRDLQAKWERRYERERGK